MPLCGFSPKVLGGLTMFTQGLYEQALKRQKEDGIPIERAFEIEVEEMNIFFTKLDERYYEELRPKHSVDEAMTKLVEWAAFYPKQEQSVQSEEPRRPGLWALGGTLVGLVIVLIGLWLSR